MLEVEVMRERVKWIISGLTFDKLTDWEEGFVESIEERVDGGLGLTEKQMDKLEEIYKRNCSV